jgi:hypothetical protein
MSGTILGLEGYYHLALPDFHGNTAAPELLQKLLNSSGR